jgi:PAS domain S-box-containing protein
MSELFGKEKKELIKNIIKRIHQGEDIKKLKEEFKDKLKGINPLMIAQIEEELIKEGMKKEEIQKFCALHLALFEEEIEETPILTEAGHPIYILMSEHRLLLKLANEFYQEILKREKERLEEIIHHFKESESHYLREENVLFPYLEKHGITQPPAIMWMEHDMIRKVKKNIYQAFEEENWEELTEKAKELAELLNSHFYKENNILFPTALNVIKKEEWPEIKKGFDEIGYCCFTPEEIIKKEEVAVIEEKEKSLFPINFETGNFYLNELEALLNTLPFDITFVDKDDTVRYFNQSKERIFLRTKAVLGRKVQQCHPPKSIHIVERILNDFKSKKRDVAEFWISHQGKFVHIRYFAVRDKNGKYLGCIEVTQDITEIKKLEGEKRIYDY